MIKTNKFLYRQNGETFQPEFFLMINLDYPTFSKITIVNREGTNLDFDNFNLEHTQEVKDFIAYVSEKAKEYIKSNYPGLDDLQIII